MGVLPRDEKEAGRRESGMKYILMASNITIWILALIEIKRLVHCMYMAGKNTAPSKSKGQSNEIIYLILDLLAHVVIWLMVIAVRTSLL